MNLVTVCGHNTTMLYHMLKHYYLHMDEIFVVLYAHHKKDPIIEEALSIMDNFNLKPYKIVYDEPFNWEKVTEYYNEESCVIEYNHDSQFWNDLCTRSIIPRVVDALKVYECMDFIDK